MTWRHHGIRRRLDMVKVWTARNPWAMWYVATVVTVSLLLQLAGLR